MSELRKASYVDAEGRKKLVLLPEEAPDEQASYGVPVGPPNLEELELPTDIEVRLNNELFVRGIFTEEDAKRRRQEIVAALMAALKVDANKVVDIYIRRIETDGATESKSNQALSNRRQSRTR